MNVRQGVVVWVFFTLFTIAYAEYSISATGGGIILPDTNVTLSNSVDYEYDRCYWYFPPENQKCIFGDGKLIRCDSKDLEEKVSYTSSNPKACQIEVNKVNEPMEGVYKSIIDGASPPGEIEIIVAKKIQSVEIRVGNESEGYLEAGKVGSIFCLLKGGKPPGEVKFYSSGPLDITSETNALINDPSGETTFSYQVHVNATIEDHEKSINCSGFQYDKSSPKKQLFDPVTSESRVLNVYFAPQPVDKEYAFSGESKEDLLVMITIDCNPAPDSLKWFVLKEINGTEERTLLKETEDYSLGTECNLVGIHKYGCNMTFKSLSHSMVNDVSYALEASNVVGEEEYPFKISLSDSTMSSTSTSTTTTPSSSTTTGTETSTAKPDEGGSSSYVVPLVIFIVIVLILIGGIVWYKKFSARRQTAPLSTQ